MNPKVSIILSFYNAEATLRRSLCDILDQTYRNIELVLIDDGSSDGSTEIAKTFVAHDERIHLIIKPNSGVSDSRNIGLDNATGDWVYFVDADDWLEHDAIEAFMNAATSPS